MKKSKPDRTHSLEILSYVDLEESADGRILVTCLVDKLPCMTYSYKSKSNQTMQWFAPCAEKLLGGMKRRADRIIDDLQTKIAALSAIGHDFMSPRKILQFRQECQMKTPGELFFGYVGYAYDGEEILSAVTPGLSKWTEVPSMSWILPFMTGKEKLLDEYRKDLEGHYLVSLQNIIDAGNDSVYAIRHPNISIVEVHRSEGGIVHLECLVLDFFPQEITVTWYKDGQYVSDVTALGIRPSGNGTFQNWKSVIVSVNDTKRYQCHVCHADKTWVHGMVPATPGPGAPESVTSVSAASYSSNFLIFVLSLAGFGLILLGILGWIRKRYVSGLYVLADNKVTS